MFKLLVVEDDRELNRAVCSFLNRNGYDALGCLSANEAYDALYGGTVFDLIISDIMMPEVDGFEFAGTIRGTDKSIPILFMTARDDFAAKHRGFHMGIDDYMVKPWKNCCCTWEPCCAGRGSPPATSWRSALWCWMRTRGARS